jgi:hypothetical protein
MNLAPRSAILPGFLLIGLFVLPPGIAAAQETAFGPGDFAEYRVGECEGTDIWFFPPFFGFPTMETWDEQIHVYARACTVTLRWEVQAVSGNVMEVEMWTEGWDRVSAGNATWSLRADDPVHAGILDKLQVRHSILVDLDTLNTRRTDGTDLGHFGFLVTSEEVAVGRAGVIKQWYGDTSVEANVTVTKDLVLDFELGLNRAYNVDTFLSIETWPTKLPFPEGLSVHVPLRAGGWDALPPVARTHDAGSSLLLVSTNSYYDDVLFNLYGVIWLDGSMDFPGGLALGLATIALQDTNIFDIHAPDSPGEDPPQPDPGDENPAGEDGSPGGEIGGDGEQEPVTPQSIWLTLGLFGAVGVTALALAVRYLRSGGGQGEPPRGGEPSRSGYFRRKP